MRHHHSFRSLKDSTLDPPENRPSPSRHGDNAGGGRIGMVAAGNPDVLREAKGKEPYAKGDERKKGGRVKRAHGGHIDGHKSKHRMDRPGRKRGGRANRDIGGGIGGSPYGGGSSPYGGGMPIGGAGGYIPTVTIGPGRGAPQPMAPAPQPSGPSMKDMANAGAGLGAIAKKYRNSYGGHDYGSPELADAAQAGVESGLTFDPETGDVYRRGGAVMKKRHSRGSRSSASRQHQGR